MPVMSANVDQVMSKFAPNFSLGKEPATKFRMKQTFLMPFSCFFCFVASEGQPWKRCETDLVLDMYLKQRKTRYFLGVSVDESSLRFQTILCFVLVLYLNTCSAFIYGAKICYRISFYLYRPGV